MSTAVIRLSPRGSKAGFARVPTLTMKASKSLYGRASSPPNAPVAKTQALSPQSCSATVSRVFSSFMRSAVLDLRFSSASPTSSLPLEDIGKDFGLLDRVVQGVVSVAAVRSECDLHP